MRRCGLLVSIFALLLVPACSNVTYEQADGAAGAVMGGLIGSFFGSGAGQAAAIATGSVVGGLTGAAHGRELDRRRAEP